MTVSRPPVAARAATRRSYWVQVGAFKNPVTATRLASLLREKLAGASRRAVTVATGPAGARLARVRIGPFAERAGAATKLHELQVRGYRPFIAEEHD